MPTRTNADAIPTEYAKQEHGAPHDRARVAREHEHRGEHDADARRRADGEGGAEQRARARPPCALEQARRDEPLGPREQAHEREPEHDEQEAGDLVAPLRVDVAADRRRSGAERDEHDREADA